MRSNLYPWDFQRVFQQESFPLELISCQGPYLERVIVQALKDSLKPEVLFAQEGPSLPLLETICQTNLFGPGPSVYLILGGEHLHQDFFHSLPKGGIPRVLIVSSKEDKKVTLQGSYRRLKVSLPPFWMNGKLLLFFLKHLGMASHPSLVALGSHHIDNMDLGPEDFWKSLSELKLKNPSPTLQEVLSLFEDLPKDFLFLSSLYAQKKFSEFYRELLSHAQARPQEITRALSFTESRLLKLRYPSYQRGKKKLSRYDASILEDRKRWAHEELDAHIKKLHQLEIESRLAKKGTPYKAGGALLFF